MICQQNFWTECFGRIDVIHDSNMSYNQQSQDRAVMCRNMRTRKQGERFNKHWIESRFCATLMARIWGVEKCVTIGGVLLSASAKQMCHPVAVKTIVVILRRA